MAKGYVPETKTQRTERIRQFIKLYVVPLGAGGIFFLILLFLVIPKISEIFGLLDTLSQDNDLITQKQQQISKLQILASNYNSLNNQLSVVNDIAPTGTTEVVKFRDKVSEMIQSNDLTILSQRLSEGTADTASTDQSATSKVVLLQEVPFIFTLEGTYTNIVKFITELSKIDDFIIVKEMQLKSNDNSGDVSGKWNLIINIVKYQFSSLGQVDLNKIYLNVSLDAKISDVMSAYIETRLGSTPNSITPVSFP